MLYKYDVRQFPACIHQMVQTLSDVKRKPDINCQLHVKEVMLYAAGFSVKLMSHLVSVHLVQQFCCLAFGMSIEDIITVNIVFFP